MNKDKKIILSYPAKVAEGDAKFREYSRERFTEIYKDISKYLNEGYIIETIQTIGGSAGGFGGNYLTPYFVLDGTIIIFKLDKNINVLE